MLLKAMMRWTKSLDSILNFWGVFLVCFCFILIFIYVTSIPGEQLTNRRCENESSNLCFVLQLRV